MRIFLAIALLLPSKIIIPQNQLICLPIKNKNIDNRQIFSPTESSYPSLLSGKPPTFSFSEAPEKFRASKDFWLHPHKNSDIIKTEWCCSPIRMTFYST